MSSRPERSSDAALRLAWTRREWATLVGAAPLFAGQSTSAPAKDADVQKKVDAELFRVKDLLLKIDVPMDTAPAFKFLP